MLEGCSGEEGVESVAEFVVESFHLGVGEECLGGGRGGGWGEVAYQCHYGELMVVIGFVVAAVIVVVAVVISDATASDCKVSGMNELPIPRMQIKVHGAERSIFLVVEFKFPHTATTCFWNLFIRNSCSIDIPSLLDGDIRFLHDNAKELLYQHFHPINAILNRKVSCKLRRLVFVIITRTAIILLPSLMLPLRLDKTSIKRHIPRFNVSTTLHVPLGLEHHLHIPLINMTTPLLHPLQKLLHLFRRPHHAIRQHPMSITLVAQQRRVEVSMTDQRVEHIQVLGDGRVGLEVHFLP
mmetsp:Transcript_17517/g.31697  ORF Transcript_17517/g.31697 Transcript_17517/m.31697 type:complete len:296 (+) Transcript_17517:450-1337(+)